MSDQPFRFTPRTARRMCLCGTQGDRNRRDASASSAGTERSGKAKAFSSTAAIGAAGTNDGETDRKPANPIPCPGPCRETGVAEHKPLNGALKGARLNYFV